MLPNLTDQVNSTAVQRLVLNQIAQIYGELQIKSLLQSSTATLSTKNQAGRHLGGVVDHILASIH